MPNMSENKVKMPEQNPKVRARNFLEVSLGLNLEQAKEEADRCLNCKTRPCVEGCPVNVQIPEFITLVKEGNVQAAYEKVLETNSLPAVCGRVCPQEIQCEKYCVRGKKGEPVAIGRLERFVSDNAELKEFKKELPKNKKVAVIGSGPAGITCAGDLAKMGYDVTIFEAFHTPGGVLMYGIPEFRLPKSVVAKEIENIKKYGVKIEKNMVIGKILNIEELFEEGFGAVFVGSGAGLPSFMNIPGENLNGVLSANEFLTRINLMGAYNFPEVDTPVYKAKKVAVVGGGNVAMDAARTALRLGAEKVYIVYRRSMDELPARKEEVHHAIEDGIEFELLTNPVRIIGDENGWVKAIECVKMELIEADSSGRRSVKEIPETNFQLEVDNVIMSIGTTPNPMITSTTKGLETTKRGCLVADENGQTSIKGVFAGGDIVTGAATVILAMGAGKKAAVAIDQYLRGEDN